MDTMQDTLIGRWPELKGQVQKRWGKLTDEDFARLSGKTEDLVSVLQRRYGYAKVQASIEINNWIRDYDRAKKENLNKSMIRESNK